MPSTMQPWCNATAAEDVFPLIRFVTTWHTLAWQFYYAARVVLAVCSPARPANGSLLKMNQYINVRIPICPSRENENRLTRCQNNVIEPTRQLCSICVADNNEGSQLNGVHLVGCCARFLTACDEQQAVLNYMTEFMEQKKWPNQADIDRLRSAWATSLA